MFSDTKVFLVSRYDREHAPDTTHTFCPVRSGVPGRVQVTQSVVDAIASTSITHEKRGSVQVKGIGEMETYFLVGRDKGGNLQFQLSENDLRVSPKRHQSELLDVLRTLEDLDLDDLSSSCNFDNNASFRSSMHQSALDGITEE